MTTQALERKQVCKKQESKLEAELQKLKRELAQEERKLEVSSHMYTYIHAYIYNHSCIQIMHMRTYLSLIYCQNKPLKMQRQKK